MRAGIAKEDRYNLCSRLSVGERFAFKPLCTTLWKSQRSLGEGDVNYRFILLTGGQLRGMQCNIPLWSDSICPEIFTKICMPKSRSLIVQTHHVTKEKQETGPEMSNELIRVIYESWDYNPVLLPFTSMLFSLHSPPVIWRLQSFSASVVLDLYYWQHQPLNKKYGSHPWHISLLQFLYPIYLQVLKFLKSVHFSLPSPQ